MKQYDLKSKRIVEVEQYCDRSLRFLYQSFFGRICLRILSSRTLSKIVGCYQNNSFSKRSISKFIEKYRIEMGDYEVTTYRSFNEFFSRKILLEKRPFSSQSKDFCAGSDAKLLVYPISENSTFQIKKSCYTVTSLLQDSKLATEYQNGYCLVFRLTVDDYHRYHFFDDGKVVKNYFLSGKLHTVSPIVYDHYAVFSENCREVSVLETKNFGKVVQIEVGAMMVGKIINLPKKEFHRGEEKGRFEFGGSTIVVLLKENAVKLDSEILKHSGEGIEIIVKMGQILGTK